MSENSSHFASDHERIPPMSPGQQSVSNHESVQSDTESFSIPHTQFIQEIIQKLDHMLQYFWKYRAKVKEVRETRRDEHGEEPTREGETDLEQNANQHTNHQQIEWKMLEMQIFEHSKSSTDSDHSQKLNFIQYYYIGKVIQWLEHESLSTIVGDTSHLQEEENEEIWRAGLSLHDGAPKTIDATTSEPPSVAADELEQIWLKYDKLREDQKERGLRHQLKMFLVVRRYLIEGLIQNDAIPERLNVFSGSETSSSASPDVDFEHVALHHEQLLHNLQIYNAKASAVCLRFIDIVHKYVMNLRYTGPASLRTFLQTVLIPLLSRASNDPQDTNLSFSESKLTYIISTYILELIPKFQFYILQFITESILPILPDALSFCILDLLYRGIIFNKTPYTFLKEYIARVIRVHKHLYMQRNEFMELMAQIRAYDMDVARRDNGLTESYFDCNSRVFSRRLISHQELAAESKQNFLLLHSIFKCAKEQYEQQCRVTILRDAMKLACLYLRNEQGTLPPEYKFSQPTQSSQLPMKLTAAEAEYFIDEFAMDNLHTYMQESMLYQHDASHTKDLFHMIRATVHCYLEFSNRLASADALMHHHHQFLLKLVDTLCHPSRRHVTKAEIKLLHKVLSGTLCRAPSMILFVALGKKSSFREEFLHPIEQFLLLIVGMCSTSSGIDYLMRTFQQTVVSLVQFLRDSLILNRSFMVNRRNGKVNDTLSMLLELCCATDGLALVEGRTLTEFSRQALLFFVRQIQLHQGSGCKVTEENWIMLNRLVGGRRVRKGFRREMKGVEANQHAGSTTERMEDST